MTSRFMFHLKFSKSEDYLHEHELYEVMRSRNLYQTQFEVRSAFKQRMRTIEKTEISENNGFINTRKLFVQKMQQRMEQADKLKQLMSVKLSKTMLCKGIPKKEERRYIPLHPTAASTTIAFPDIVQKLKTPSPVHAAPRSSDGSLSRASDKATSEIASSLPYDAPSPSMAASTVVATMGFGNNNKSHQHHEAIVTVVHSQINVHAKGTDSIPYEGTEGTHSEGRNIEGETEPENDLQYEKTDVLPELKANWHPMNFKKAYVTGNINIQFAHHGKNDASNSHANTTIDQFTTTGDLESESVTAKVEHWTMQYGLISRSKQEVEDEKTFRRLLVDRPSKWALSHVHNNTLKSSYNMSRANMNSDKKAEPTFNKEAEQSRMSTKKLKTKTKAYASLPELEKTGKPMVCMDPGGTTPDGRLILTKAHYDGYLYDYRQANTMRLSKSKVKSKILNRLVNDFTISPKLQTRTAKETLAVQSEP